MRARFIASLGSFLLGALILGVAAAQAPSSTDSGGGDPSRPGFFANLMDAMESGSRLLISAIQPGGERDLVNNPQFNSQESPRHAMMTFLEAMALVDRGYEEIGRTRAMNSLPDGAAAAQADELYAVLLRLGPVSAAELPGPESANRSGDARFEYFPFGMDHQWIWEAVDPPIGAQIALQRRAEGDWRFTGETVAGAGALLESLSGLPPRYDRRDTGQYFLQTFAPLFERTGALGWIAFIGLSGAAVAAGFGFNRALKWTADRVAGFDREFLASTIRSFGAAGGLVIFTVIFSIAIGFLELGPVLGSLRYAVPRFLMVIAVALLLISLTDVAAAVIRRRVGEDGSHYDRMVVTMIRRILRAFLIALVIMFLLQNILGMNIGAMLVGFGFIALALSLAAQDTVKNFFGAVSVFINRPFVIGDWVTFKGEAREHVGVVEDIQLQAVKIQDLHGNLVTIPNMLFIDREVQNLSARGHIRREVKIALPYGGDARTIDAALEAMMDAFTDEEVVEDALSEGRDGEPHVSFADFEESWLGLRGYHYYFMGEEEGELQRDNDDRGYFSYLSHCSLVNRKIVEKFNERGLAFAFPTQTVFLDKTEKPASAA